MVCDFGLIFFTSFAIGIFAIYFSLKRANDLFYTSKFNSKVYNIPPGDMSLPFIGNMFTFFTTFKYGDPESFISYFTSRYFHYLKSSFLLLKKGKKIYPFLPFILSYWSTRNNFSIT